MPIGLCVVEADEELAGCTGLQSVVTQAFSVENVINF